MCSKSALMKHYYSTNMVIQIIIASLHEVLKEAHVNQFYRFKKEVLNEAKDENLSLLGRKFLNRIA
jgi:hypothetical protein